VSTLSSVKGDSSLPWKKLIAIFFIASGVVAGYKNFQSRSGGGVSSIASHIGSSMNAEQIAALAASSKAEDVLFYTAPWCPYCAQAKTWLAQSGFKYEECDIEARSECASQLRALGSDGVPYLIVKGHHMKDGFDSDEFVAALAQK
jgi:glutaredoxin